MFSKNLFIFEIVLFSLFLIPFLVQAIKIPNPLEWDTIEEVIEGIIDFIFWVAIAIAPIMIIVAGAFFIFSGGNPDRIRTAKNIILYTIIGLAIVLLAKGIISVVREIIGAP